MLRNYLIIAWRNILRHKVYSVINITGLAVGMACTFMILAFVRFELSYDQYHEDADRIYRVLRQRKHGLNAVTGAPVAPLLQREFPGVEYAVRLGRFKGNMVRRGDKSFIEDRFFFADANLFNVFTLKLLRGDPQKVLEDPFSVVLTPEMAARYFGIEDPLGKTITYEFSGRSRDFTVTGIAQNNPTNTHFHFDFLASFKGLKAFIGSHFFTNHWDSPVWTYVKLQPSYSPEEMDRLLPALADRSIDRGSYPWDSWKLQPLTEIHLAQVSAEIEPERQSNPGLLYTLAALALIILLIACINFMNLATARSVTRAREVGIRKVVGGHRFQLIKQFLGESVLLSGIALAFALMLMELLLPAFNRLVGRELFFTYGDEPQLLLLMLGIALIVGLVAGSYPAFSLSMFKPVQVLKGEVSKTGGRSWLRRGLVVVQFTLSIALIIGMMTIEQQHRFLTTRYLGFDKEFLVSLPLPSGEGKYSRQYMSFKNELLNNPHISGVTASSNKPGVTGHNGITIRAPGADEETQIGIMYVDFDYTRTLDIEMVAGRDFSNETASDTEHAILLNESALGLLGADFEPGKAVELFWRERDKIIPAYDATVVGIVRDFNHRPYIRPQALVFAIASRHNEQALIRISPDQLLERIDFIKARWQQFFPDRPFQFSFLDEDIEAVYRAEKRWQKIFTHFAILAVFIACLGLFGLASFTTERRTKEIGIRKVLGASVPDIVVLLVKEFTWLVAMSNLVAWPVAYFILEEWLQGYSYRIDMGPSIFLLAGMAALAIAWSTVSYQAIRAALSNPVDALRYE